MARIVLDVLLEFEQGLSFFGSLLGICLFGCSFPLPIFGLVSLLLKFLSLRFFFWSFEESSFRLCLRSIWLRRPSLLGRVLWISSASIVSARGAAFPFGAG